jgi:DNA-binding NarL/FixJ family response regulator
VFLLERGAAGDRDEARTLLDEALALAQKRGMPPIERCVREAMKRLQPAATVRPAGLTDRELEILRLLAAGKTDKEIAFELSISVKTASNHVGNILGKIGAGNRTEAARYALEHGLAR